MIQIIWSGKGWVVPAATFGLSLISEILWEGTTGDEEYYQVHGFPVALALWLSAAVVFAVYWSLYLAPQQGGRSRKRKKSKRKRLGWVDHSFFFVNLWAWSAILGVCGLGILLVRGV